LWVFSASLFLLCGLVPEMNALIDWLIDWYVLSVVSCRVDIQRKPGYRIRTNRWSAVRLPTSLCRLKLTFHIATVRDEMEQSAVCMHDIVIYIHSFIMPPPSGALSDAFVWRLTSVCRIHRSKSRTERPRKTKIGKEVAHVSRDSDTLSRSKVKVIRPLYSPPCRRVGQLQRWAWERVGREKLLLRCRLLGLARRFGADGEERGGGISWRPPAYSLFIMRPYSVQNI